MIKEEKIEFTAIWCKFSKYKITKYEDKIYIIPDEKAIPSTYDPFTVKNQILKDLLVIGKEAIGNDVFQFNDSKITTEAQSKTEKFQALILEFVNKYGLLGLFRYLPKGYDFLDKEGIPVNIGYNIITSAIDFEKKYFWNDSKINWANSMKADDFQRNSGLDASFKQSEGDRLNDFIFSKNYAEPISEIIDFAASIYSSKLLICAYLYDDVSEDIKEVYKNGISANKLKHPDISYGVENGKIKFKWNYMSLCDIIDTILLLNETNDRTEVKLCKHCHKPFIAENIKTEYDTIQCRNKENINKSRQKKLNFIN